MYYTHTLFIVYLVHRWSNTIEAYGKELFYLQEAADSNEASKLDWLRTLETRVDGRGGLRHT